MAIAITGGKYASAAVSAVGTTTVTVSTTPFVSGDFASTRLVGLWGSAGAFKGMAWVRKWVSTSQLQLQTAFFDPATGASVTQAVGDTVLVSKNFTESAVAGLAVSGKTVTVTDGTSVTFGTAGSANSVCFYDEDKLISTNCATLFAGGLAVFGKLDDYARNVVSYPCSWYLTGNNPPTNSHGIRVTNAAANACMYGGQISGDTSKFYYIGGNVANTGGGTAGNTLVFNTVTNAFSFDSPNAGGSWGTAASRHQLINCSSITSISNSIMSRWGDGVVSGGTYKFPNGTTAPISVFGSDIASTVVRGAPAGQRAVVQDFGGSAGGSTTPALVRAGGALAVVFNFTNLITTDFRSVTGFSGAVAANPLGTNRFYFCDTYSGLVASTVGVVLDGIGTVVQSGTGLSGAWSPTLLRRTCVGSTVTVNATGWTYGLKAYGYLPVAGSITPSTYSLGTAGDADNVAFGGAVNQVPDSLIVLSAAQAAALTSISTLNDLYAAVMNWATSSVANAQYPSLSAYPVVGANGAVDAGTRTVVIDPAAVAAFAVNAGTHVLTVKATSLASASKFDTLTAAGITVNAGASVSCNLAGPVTNAGALTGEVVGNVTNTGSLGAGCKVTGNVTQAAPASMTGVTITGDLTFNTNTDTTITLTGCTITGTVSNTGTGTVTVASSGSSIGTFGTRVVAKPATVTFTGLATGARVVVYNAGVMSETATATGSSLAMTTTYEVGTALTWRVFGAGKNPAAGTVTLNAAGANTVPVTLTSADGLTTGGTVRAINGTTVNAAGQVSVDTTGKTITFHSAVDIRAALSAIQTAWATQSVLYSLDIPIPFTLESVSGLLIRNDWTLVNPDTSTGEGYALVNPATGTATQVNLDFISKGNTADVQVGLIYDGVTQPTITMPGELDYLFIDVDPTPSTIQVNALVKRQDIVFIDRTETLRTGGVWGRFFRNAQTSFAQTVDATVTALLPADTAKYRLVQAPFTPPVDNNGLAHTFARVIEVETGTTSRADLINQLAAVATFDPYYRAKPYTVSAAGKIVMEPGTWVRYRDGSPLSGNAAALFTFTSTAGEYVQPETRLLSLKLDDRAIYGCQYVVYRKATGAVLLDASGGEVTGTLTTANRSALITVQSSTDIDLIVASVGTGVAEGYAPVTLGSGTSTVTIATAPVTIITPDPTQTLNDPATGVLAWHPIITDAIFDPDARDIIIPTQTVDGQVVKSYNLAYFYMAWRKWITADVRRMRHGWAVYSEHQLAPPGAADLAYKFTPGTVFNDGWALNVPASRAMSDIVRLEASLIGRRDVSANSGLVYRSPLANGATTMAEVVISGAATEVIRNAYNQTVANAKEIARLKNSLGWLIRGGKLLGIKPMPAAYSKTTDYTGEV